MPVASASSGSSSRRSRTRSSAARPFWAPVRRAGEHGERLEQHGQVEEERHQLPGREGIAAGSRSPAATRVGVAEDAAAGVPDQDRDRHGDDERPADVHAGSSARRAYPVEVQMLVARVPPAASVRWRPKLRITRIPVNASVTCASIRRRSSPTSRHTGRSRRIHRRCGDVHEGKQRAADGKDPPLDEAEGHPRSEELDQGPPGLKEHDGEQAGGAAHILSQEARQPARLVRAKPGQRQPDRVREDLAAKPGLKPAVRKGGEVTTPRADGRRCDGHGDEDDGDRRQQLAGGRRQADPPEDVGYLAMTEHVVKGEARRRRRDQAERGRDRDGRERHGNPRANTAEERPEHTDQLADRAMPGVTAPRAGAPRALGRMGRKCSAVVAIAEPTPPTCAAHERRSPFTRDQWRERGHHRPASATRGRGVRFSTACGVLMIVRHGQVPGLGKRRGGRETCRQGIWREAVRVPSLPHPGGVNTGRQRHGPAACRAPLDTR